MSENLSCPECKYQIDNQWYYCPNCGKILKDKLVSVPLLKQVFIYLISFFLAPFGLAWGIKYIRNKNAKVKIVGIISIVLTVISICLLFVVYKYFMDQYANLLNNLNVNTYSR